MSKSVEFFFDFGSPTSYLANTQLPSICARAGAQLIYRPILLRSLFEATGNSSPVRIPAKGRYLFNDFQRFARRYEVPLSFNPNFPINTLPLIRGAIALQLRGETRFAEYVEAMYRAIWVEARNLNDSAVLAETLRTNDFDPETVQADASSQDVDAVLETNIQDAVAGGVFGVPTMFVGDEMFFGQDRLDFVSEALA
ncbi:MULTISPECIES: 2-hydroxychromene-2-carboxylate isomerase [Pseudomonas]|uniref:2-hydroxychromene-2-carboxylate isomerase n=1 Tax=Pseudomonadaceae TaxID=135621 RepID=UPI0010FA282D|nr:MULTISPECIES: 2-hydroxychromene-2-carboxylate isomerase [Pseudomonas]MDE3737264.1 2-hydroxychromene-2-carboxylate isomerase [Pseudomonas resinovorans]